MSLWVFIEQIVLAVLLVVVAYQQRKNAKLQKRLLEHDKDIYTRLGWLEDTVSNRL